MPRRRSAADERYYRAMLERTQFWTGKMLLRLVPVLARVHKDIRSRLRARWRGRVNGITRGDVDEIVPDGNELRTLVGSAMLPTFWQAYWSEGTLQLEAIRQAFGRPPPAPAVTEDVDGDALIGDGRGSVVLFGGGTSLHVAHWQEMPTVVYRTDLRVAVAAAHELRAELVGEALARGSRGRVTHRVDAEMNQWLAEGTLAENVRPVVFVLRLPLVQVDELRHEAPGLWMYRGRRDHYGVAYDLMERESEDALQRVWRELYTPEEERRLAVRIGTDPDLIWPPGSSPMELHLKDRIEVPLTVEPFRNFPGDPTAARNMVGHQFRFAGKVADHLRTRLTGEFIAGIGAGENMAKLQERVRTVFEGKDPMRASVHGAERIARTESQRALVMAQQNAYRQIGVTELRKGWRNAGDIRVRPEHGVDNLDLLTQTPLIDESFDVMGVAMMHPLDPTAPSYLVIRCRCTLIPITPKRMPLPRGFRLTAELEGKLVVNEVGSAPGFPTASPREQWKRADVDGRKQQITDIVRQEMPADVEGAEVYAHYRDQGEGRASIGFGVRKGGVVTASRSVQIQPGVPTSARNQSIQVHPSHRGKGIASAVYRASEKVFAAIGVKVVETGAIHMGVRVWTRAKFGYRVAWEPAVGKAINRWLEGRGWSEARRNAYVVEMEARAVSTEGLLAAEIDRDFWESGGLDKVNLYRNLPKDRLGF